MTLSKSFLNRFKIIQPGLFGLALLSVVPACTNGPTTKGASIIQSGMLYTPSTPIDVNGQVLAGPEKELAGQLKPRFCRAGKQVRALKQSITLVLPVVPLGMPIDEANRLKQEFVRLGRQDIKEFFYITSVSQQPIDDSKRSLRSPEVYGLPYDASIKADPTRYLSKFSSYPISAFKGAGSPSNDTFFIVLGRRTFLIPNSFINYRSWGNPRILVNQEATFGRAEEQTGMGGNSAIINTDLRLRFAGIDKELSISSETGKELRIAPLRVLHQRYSNLIVSKFVLLVPRDIEDRFFTSEFDSQRDFGSRAKQERMMASTALKLSPTLWRRYFSAFTSVKEAPGKTVDSIEFEVSLDLTLFCSYAHPISEVMSQ